MSHQLYLRIRLLHYVDSDVQELRHLNPEFFGRLSREKLSRDHWQAVIDHRRRHRVRWQGQCLVQVAEDHLDSQPYSLA